VRVTPKPPRQVKAARGPQNGARSATTRPIVRSLGLDGAVDLYTRREAIGAPNGSACYLFLICYSACMDAENALHEKRARGYVRVSECLQITVHTRSFFPRGGVLDTSMNRGMRCAA